MAKTLNVNFKFMIGFKDYVIDEYMEDISYGIGDVIRDHFGEVLAVEYLGDNKLANGDVIRVMMIKVNSDVDTVEYLEHELDRNCNVVRVATFTVD